MSEVSQLVKDIAAELKTGATLGDDNRVTFQNEEKIFTDKLGIEIPEVVKVQDALLTFSAAQTLATGELGQPHLVSNKDVSRVSSRSTIGRSRIDTAYDRQVSGTAAGKEWCKRGRASTDITLGTGASTRAYRDVVSHLAAEGDKVFSN